MPEIAILIVLMALVTFIPRVMPILLLSRRDLPRPVVTWLSYVPVTVLAALLAPALFAPTGEFCLSFTHNPSFWVSIPVFAVAILTRNLFITVIAGMVLIALYRFLLL